MADLGTDLRWPLGRVFTLVSARTNLGWALARRYMTPRGGLFYDPNYGFSLIALLSSEAPESAVLAVGAQIEGEALKDERVLSASADLSFDSRTRKLTITLSITDADGPFVLVLEASQVTVALLQVA